MKKIVLLLLILSCLPLAGQLKVARIFTDHGVLQRQKEIPVWGWAAPHEKVTVSLAKTKQSAKADELGYWVVKLPAMEAGGPHTLTIVTRANTITLNDILIGEVWICSGQSNMGFTVSSAQNFLIEKNAANHPQIRHFQVENRLELEPVDDLNTGSWVVCSPETVGSFTAAGYFFARDLAERLNVPVGLINSSWGGSQVEGWISREGFEQSKVLNDYLKTMPKTWEESNVFLDKKIKQNFFGTTDVNITADQELQYLQKGYDFSGWRNGYAPGNWDWQGIWAFRGQGYTTTEINIPAAMVSQETLLGLGLNDSPMKLLINGNLIWEGQKSGKHLISLPAHTWVAGSNRLLIKFGVVQEPSWFGMGLDGSENDLFVRTSDLSASLPIGGHTWKMMPAFGEPHVYAQLMNNVGTTIYNAMIHPIIPYAMRGVIWYQGEANTNRAFEYRSSFPDLINDWRKKWGETFPFFFAQLSSYGPNQNSNEGSDWAELREAQTMALALPQTGMAVTIDVGDAKDIHPTNKQDVGKRLAAIALNQTYNTTIPWSGPMYQSMKVDGHQVVVSFSHTGNGLTANDKYQYVRGFELAGSDRVFYYAQARIENNTVIVSCREVENPVAVRYAWSNAPTDANLFNQEGFPGAPFRSDDWPGITVHGKFE